MPRRNDPMSVKEGAGRYCRWLRRHSNHGQERYLSRWAAITLALSLLLCLTVAVEAGMVYGRVYGAEEAFKPGDTFLLTKKNGSVIKVKTDDSRSYSVIIEPGVYKVEFIKGGMVWETFIQSFSGPVRQDIYLKRR